MDFLSVPTSATTSYHSPCFYIVLPHAWFFSINFECQWDCQSQAFSAPPPHQDIIYDIQFQQTTIFIPRPQTRNAAASLTNRFVKERDHL